MGSRKLARSFTNFCDLFWGRDAGWLAEDFKHFFDDKFVEENDLMVATFSVLRR